MVDRNGNEWRFEYTSTGILSRIIDPVGLTTVFASSNGRITTITDPANRVTQLQYDLAGNLERVVAPDTSAKTWRYDNSHRITAQVDERGYREEVYYDFSGKATFGIRKDGTRQQYQPLQNANLFTPERTIDPIDSPEVSPPSLAIGRYVSPNGNSMRVLLDRQGQARGSVDSVGSRGSVERNTKNLVTKVVSGRGFETQFEYDSLGNVTQIQDKLQSTTIQNPAVLPGQVFATAGRAAFTGNADFNGDGREDIAIAHRNEFGGNTVAILLGNGDGTLQSPIVTNSIQDPTDLKIADFNGDGFQDLLVSSRDKIAILWAMETERLPPQFRLILLATTSSYPIPTMTVFST